MSDAVDLGLAAGRSAERQGAVPSAVTRSGNLGLAAAVILGFAIIWGAPHPPMMDLPQHAGQLTLLRQLLFGRSPFAGELRINVFTPYLLGYALTLPLSLIMPVATAIKLVLTAAFLGFTGFGVLLRRELGASPRLDLYFPLNFFGVAFGWGLYTFLLAAPVAMAFIWLATVYARRRGSKLGAGVAALGLALLVCHGLAFLLAISCGGLVLLGTAKGPRDFLRAVWPYLAIGLILAVYLLSQREVGAEGVGVHWGGLVERAQTLTTGFASPTFSPALTWMFLILALAPFLIGLRVGAGRRESLLICGTIVLANLLVPSEAWATSLVFQRLGLFLLPAYALIFREPEGAARASVLARLVGTTALVASCLGVLTWHAVDTIRFGREQVDFERTIARLDPGQRALALIFDRQSRAADMPEVYLHYASWYQAEKDGFVEFNFAWFHPEVVRYRRSVPAGIGTGLSWRPDQFDWNRDRGERYRYFLARSDGPPTIPAFAQAACRPALVAQSGEWFAYDAKVCASG